MSENDQSVAPEEEKLHGNTVPDAVVQKQIGVVTELQELVSEQARQHDAGVQDSANALLSAIHGLTCLDSCDRDPADIPMFDVDAEALASAIEAGIDRALSERGIKPDAAEKGRDLAEVRP